MSNIEQMIENASALSKSLKQAADDFVAALTSMRNQAVSIEADLHERKIGISNEIDRLSVGLEGRRQEHRQVEQSIAGLRAQLASLQADFQADRNKIKAMFSSVLEKRDA